MGQAGVFSDVDSDVCVERLQRFGEELVGEGVEAVGAPVQPGPFQKVKSSKTSTPKFDPAGQVFAHLSDSECLVERLILTQEDMLAFQFFNSQNIRLTHLKMNKGAPRRQNKVGLNHV